MAEWRIGRGWSESELEERLDRIRDAKRNFAEPPELMSLESGWNRYYSEAVLAREAPGPPDDDGLFARGRLALVRYEFSDPLIVIGHFDPDAPLEGRRMLLEMRALRVLHYLAGVAVGAVRDGSDGRETVFGWRYDTLEGHIETGSEWFLLVKDHASGRIRFRIDAYWRPGQFPNWWSRAGFSVLGPWYQRRWHRRAHRRLARLMRDVRMDAPVPHGERLVHEGPEITFRRFEGKRNA